MITPDGPREELRALIHVAVDQAVLIDIDQVDTIADAVTALFAGIEDRWFEIEGGRHGDKVIDRRFLQMSILRESRERHAANRTVE